MLLCIIVISYYMLSYVIICYHVLLSYLIICYHVLSYANIYYCYILLNVIMYYCYKGFGRGKKIKKIKNVKTNTRSFVCSTLNQENPSGFALLNSFRNNTLLFLNRPSLNSFYFQVIRKQSA